MAFQGPQQAVYEFLLGFQGLQRLETPFLRMLMRRMPSTCSAYRLSRFPLACAHHTMSSHSCATGCQHKGIADLLQQGTALPSNIPRGSLGTAESAPLSSN